MRQKLRSCKKFENKELLKLFVDHSWRITDKYIPFEYQNCRLCTFRLRSDRAFGIVEFQKSMYNYCMFEINKYHHFLYNQFETVIHEIEEISTNTRKRNDFCADIDVSE